MTNINKLIRKYAAWNDSNLSSIVNAPYAAGRAIGNNIGDTFGRLSTGTTDREDAEDALFNNMTEDEYAAYLKRETDLINRRIRIMQNKLEQETDRAAKAVRSPFI
ncbi:MAG: hypothetical protein Q4D38_00085 [Planctomycetia bacterium]|nr:hypothetical protein [Planctomycetia bacterium]